ncbi:MAG TPA: YncE family protein, partial [Gemmatimonadaceae bacterium]|nr:YncE family protein [Gemmatimonadaceae bacterium]
TQTSLTPASWRSSPQAQQAAPKSGLTLVAELPLPGPANRFDYQSVDTASGRIYMNHMNAGSTIVFDADSSRVVAEIPNVRRATGVLVVPAHHQVYISSGGSGNVAIVDDRTLRIVARVDDVLFPDGIGYASHADKVFVSDEAGGNELVIDPVRMKKRSLIRLGGEAGNTHYDSVSKCILVAVQTRNELVAIDPVREKVVQRYKLAGSDHPHGFVIADEQRLAFVTSEESAKLQVLDLRTMRVLSELTVGGGPDVIAWDPGWRRLYVATEGGGLNTFWLDGTTLRSLGDIHADNAHTVSVDPRTHRVFLPLQNVGGHPVLRIYQPSR